MTVEELEDVIDSQAAELKLLYEAIKQIQQVNRQDTCWCTGRVFCESCKIREIIDGVY